MDNDNSGFQREWKWYCQFRSVIKFKESSRTGTITIAGDIFTVTQSGAVPCPNCSGTEVFITNMIFPAECDCECVGTKSITIGTGVTIKNGGKVTLKAPKVKVQSGFHAETGSVVKIRQQ